MKLTVFFFYQLCHNMPYRPRWGVEIYLYSGAILVLAVTTRPGRFTLGNEMLYPLYRRLDGLQRLYVRHHPPTLKQAGLCSISMTQEDFPNPFASLVVTGSYLSEYGAAL
jgi:hypothetical protein